MENLDLFERIAIKTDKNGVMYSLDFFGDKGLMRTYFNLPQYAKILPEVLHWMVKTLQENPDAYRIVPLDSGGFVIERRAVEIGVNELLTTLNLI